MIYYCLVKSSRKHKNAWKLSIQASQLVAHAQYQNKGIDVKLLKLHGGSSHTEWGIAA